MSISSAYRTLRWMSILIRRSSALGFTCRIYVSKLDPIKSFLGANLDTENMVRPRFLSRSKKSVSNVSSKADISEGHQDDTAEEDPDQNTRDCNFSYADMNELSAKLLEQSRRSKGGFFNHIKPRRPRTTKLPRTNSEGCLIDDGLQAPTSTPATVSLRRHASMTSTTSTTSGWPNCHGSPNMSKISIAETCSTTPDEEPELSTKAKSSSEETVDCGVEVCGLEDIMRSTTLHDNACQEPLRRNNSSFSLSSNLGQAARWGRNVLSDIKIPLRRRVRPGKEPSTEIYPPPPIVVYRIRPSIQEIEAAFAEPSSSRKFDGLNLQGGTGPPKKLSLKTIDKLRKLDLEHIRAQREKVRLLEEEMGLLPAVVSDYEAEICVRSKRKSLKDKVKLTKIAPGGTGQVGL